MELIERLIRAGVYMGPLNLAIAGYGGGTLGRNPYHWMDIFLRQVPQGAVPSFWSSMRGLISLSAMAIVLGQHVRVGNEDNLWGADKKRRTTVQQIEGAVRMCREFGREVATAEKAREIMKIGVWYDSIEETLRNLGLPPNRTDGPAGLPGLGDRRQDRGGKNHQQLASDRLRKPTTTVTPIPMSSWSGRLPVGPPGMRLKRKAER